MASAAYPGGSSSIVNKTNADKFIPEIWSDEIVASYKKALVMANLINKMSMKGKKGDTLHIPVPTRGSAFAKAANTAVTIQADVETEVQVLLNKHFEYSRFIEDIVEVQALSSLRRFYTEDAGYALARQVDTDLIQLGRSANNGAGTAAYANAYIGGDGSTAYNSGTPNASALTDAGIRRMIQRLDDNDVPMTDRYLVVPPSSRNTLMGIDRFTEQAFVGETAGGNTIRNGQIGDVYGVKVFVTPQCDTATGSARIALIFHKDAAVMAEQMGVRSQTQYKQEYLATLFTSDMLYGVSLLRKGDLASVPTSMFPIAVPA
jgi:N4-gp56 family major capsid protein